MKTALFTNFSEEEFIGYWNGKGKPFKPGESRYMPDYLAAHFAKHLTNRELLRIKPDGTPVYKDGEKMTSPKRPEDVPLYTELFKKAYQPEEDDELMNEGDSIDTAIDMANKNREERKAEVKQEESDPQVILSPDFEEDEDDSEEEPAEAQSDASVVGLAQ